MVVFKENDASEKKNRGRKITSVVLGPISASFELPHFCYGGKINIEKLLAAPPKMHANYGKDIDITPLADRRFSVIERANNWTVQLRKRNDNRIDIICTHLPSNKQFRSKPEVANFILYEARPKPKSKEEKKTENSSGCNEKGSTSKKRKKEERETYHDIPPEEAGTNMMEWID
ncbi:uncharacterized protein LOC131631430 [Vicia villosa]|uniref:uncharacterized protein LOC131631430 n=1 Tax=Vicia villosa TaxID=3911 RepID=UPI00273BCA17|nr:uncharacterized protein LOC131631430 [Vicia villosa]